MTANSIFLRALKVGLSMVVLMSLVAQTVFSETFIVTSGDDSGDGTLRDAISDSLSSGGEDTIIFSGVSSVVNVSPYNLIGDPDPLTIDGEDGVTITRTDSDVDSIFYIGQNDVTLQNLSIVGSGSGYGVYVGDSLSDVSLDNISISGATTGIYVGSGTSGFSVTDSAISENSDDGISINGGASDFTISGNEITENGDNGLALSDSYSGGYSGIISGNTISGNTESGIEMVLYDTDYEDLRVYGNMIGTTSDGTEEFGNGGSGISVTWNVSGGDGSGVITFGEGGQLPNIISGNSYGISVNNRSDWYSGYATVKIQNNFIGTNGEGTAAIGNTTAGIYFDDPYLNLLVGVEDDENEFNLISGNAVPDNGSDDTHPKAMDVDNAHEVTIYGNLIGVAADGITALKNEDGIYIGSAGSEIDSVDIFRNVIAGTDSLYESGMDVYTGTALKIENDQDDDNTPQIRMQGNLFGIGMDGESNIGGGYGVRVMDGVLVFGGMNYFNQIEDGMSDEDFADEVFDFLGQGNIVSNFVYDRETQYDYSALMVGGGYEGSAPGVKEAYVYGNIFGLKRGASGEFDSNAGNSDGNIDLYSENLHYVEVGAVDLDHVKVNEYCEEDDLYCIVGLPYFEDASQLRNILSGYPENAPDGDGDDDGMESLGDSDLLSVGNMCDGDNCDNDIGFSIVNVVNNYIGSIIAYDGTIMEGGDDALIRIVGGAGIVLEDGDMVNIGCRYDASGMVPGFDDCDYDGDEDGFPDSGNVISGSLGGVIFGARSEDDESGGEYRLLGNYIGVDSSGVTALPNMIGVMVDEMNSGSEVYIGYTGEDSSQYSKNVISGNIGVNLIVGGGGEGEGDDDGTVEVSIAGNYIGPDANGEELEIVPYPVDALLSVIMPEMPEDVDINVPDIDLYAGIGVIIMEMDDMFDSIVIGGDTEYDRNVISGNGITGILVLATNNEGNEDEDPVDPDPALEIKGNYIGLAPDGVTPLPNKRFSFDPVFESISDLLVNFMNEMEEEEMMDIDITHQQVEDFIDFISGMVDDLLNPINGSGIAVIDAGILISDGENEEEMGLVSSGIEIVNNYISGNEGSGLVLYHMEYDLDGLLAMTFELLNAIGIEDFGGGDEDCYGYCDEEGGDDDDGGPFDLFEGIEDFSDFGYSIRIHGGQQVWEEDSIRGNYFGVDVNEEDVPNATADAPGTASVSIVNMVNNDGRELYEEGGDPDGIVFGDEYPFSDNVVHGGFYIQMLTRYDAEEWIDDNMDTMTDFLSQDIWTGEPFWSDMYQGVIYVSNETENNPEISDNDYDPPTCYWNGGSLICEWCGNRVVESGEECDDGNGDNRDTCSNSCESRGGGGGGTLLVCPDGYHEVGGECVQDGGGGEDIDECPVGYELNWTGECVNISCPEGTELHGNRCVTPGTECTGPNCGGTTTPPGGGTTSPGGGGGGGTYSGSFVDIPKETEPEHEDECAVDSDCGANNVCERGVNGNLVCAGADDSKCSSILGGIDTNSNGIPDCLDVPDVENLSPKDAADRFVFGLTGEEPLVPGIVNLDGKVVDQNPLILITYIANAEVFVEMEEVDTGKKLILKNQLVSDVVTGKKEAIKVIDKAVEGSYTDDQLVIGKTKIDVEYKGQISIDTPIPVGKYYATPIGDDGIRGNTVAFEVAKTDMEIIDLKIQEDENPELINIQPMVKQVLGVIEKTDDSGRFVANEYVDYRKKKLMVERQYKIYAKINSKDKNKKIAYFTYKSVLYSSVALTDVSPGTGEYITVPVPEYVPKNESHILTMYVTDLDSKKISSMKSIRFTME